MRIVAVIGPSGAGKDTLMRHVARHRPDLHLIRRVITRDADAGGEDFDAVTAARFEQMRADGGFALDWQAHGLRYGIPHPRPGGGMQLVNLSRGAIAQAARVFPGLIVIHVDATPEVRALRLAARGRESAKDIAARIAREVPTCSGAVPVTHIDNSGDLDTAVSAFLAALDEVTIP